MQEAPKSEIWCQHGANMTPDVLGRWDGWAPLKVDTTGIFYMYIQHIDLTRLGTEGGAADLMEAQPSHRLSDC